MNYIAVKLDMVKSRRVSDRAQLQQRLFEIVEEINIRHATVVKAKFVITHGDEVQGLLHNDYGELVSILEYFYDRLVPHTLRVGVGLGALHTRLQPTAIGMDGPAWHRADEAIDQAARSRKFVRFSGFGRLNDDAYSSLGNLLLWQRHRWTDAQRQVIEHLENGVARKQIAATLNITPAAVSNRLNAAGWKYYEDARRVLKMLLRENMPAMY